MDTDARRSALQLRILDLMAENRDLQFRASELMVENNRLHRLLLGGEASLQPEEVKGQRMQAQLVHARTEAERVRQQQTEQASSTTDPASPKGMRIPHPPPRAALERKGADG